jgi:uncharacterized protein (TIGR03437 family)
LKVRHVRSRSSWDSVGSPHTHPEDQVKLLEIQGNVQAKVLYYGTAPGEIAGLMQINVKVPMMAPTGTAVALRLTVGNNISPASATVSIR